MYQELYKTWNREKAQEELQPLDQDIYLRATEYLQGLNAREKRPDLTVLVREIARRELDISSRLLASLIDERFAKMVSALTEMKQIPQDLLSKEEKRISKVFQEAYSARSELKSWIEKEETTPREEPPALQKMLVRFMQDLPAIIGVDLRTYGPFKKEDIGVIPAENAKALLDQKTVLKIELRPH